MNDLVADLTFEESLQELEAIVSQLEEGALSLDDSLRLFERGQLLATRCSKQLEEATLRVEQLTDQGEIVPVNVE